MNLSAHTLPLWLNLVSMAFVCWVLVMAFFHIPWSELKKNTGLQHRLGFSVLMLVVIWSLRAGVTDGLGLHFFLITTLHVVFGWQYAIWVVGLVQLGLTVFGVESPYAFGMNAITSGVIPILVTYACWRYVERKEMFNPFAFIFGVGFAGAIVSVLASAVFVSVVYLATSTFSFYQLQYELWPFLPLIALPEGIINGMLIAGLVVFKPEWVLLFDEKKYYQ